MKSFPSIEDLRQRDRRNVPKMFFDYAEAGSYSEETLRSTVQAPAPCGIARPRSRRAGNRIGRLARFGRSNMEVSSRRDPRPPGLPGGDHMGKIKFGGAGMKKMPRLRRGI